MEQATRTRTLLRQIAGGRDVPKELFAPGRVIVALGSDVRLKPQAQLMFSMAVNLLARLHPVVQHLEIAVPDQAPLLATRPRWPGSSVAEHLAVLLRALRPPVTWRIHREPIHLQGRALIIGGGPPIGAPTIFVGGDGWEVAVSPTEPQSIGDAVNPVAAYAGACLAVAEIWKHSLVPHGELLSGVPIIPLDETLHLSTLTYRAERGGPNPRIPNSVDLGQLTLVGLGAGGGATAFTLATLPELSATLNLIEPDAIEASNLNRYIFAGADDADQSCLKTAVVHQLFGRFRNVVVREFPVSFREAVPTVDVGEFRHVMAAVHSRQARRDIQQETPMVLWDAAAEEGEFGIWRMVLGQTECMWCKHPPDGREPERDKAEQLAQMLGLDAATWLRKLQNNERFTAEDVAAMRLPSGAGFELPDVGQQYGAWDATQCGRLLFPNLDGSVPVPFAPVLAGVLSAGEIIKEHAFPEFALDSYYWNTLTGQFMKRNRPQRRPPKKGCALCSDPTFISQHARRWQ